jgi:hypothetical protein
MAQEMAAKGSLEAGCNYVVEWHQKITSSMKRAKLGLFGIREHFRKRAPKK